MFCISCVSFLTTHLNIFHCPQYLTTYAVKMPTVLHVYAVCNRNVQIQGATSPWRPLFVYRRLIFGNPQYGTCFLLPFWRLEFFLVVPRFFSGPGSSVGITTDYGLDGPESNPSVDEIFRPSRPALGPTQSPVKWVPGLFRGVKCGRGVLLTTHPVLVPRSWKSRAKPLPTL